MKNVETLVQGLALIQDFLIERTAALPDDVRAKLREVIAPGIPSPVACRTALELIYARRDELPVELLQIGVQITQLMTHYQQLGYQNGRGGGILTQLLSIDGVAIVTNADTPEAPKPDPQFTPTPEADVNANTPKTTAPVPVANGPTVVPPSPVG